MIPDDLTWRCHLCLDERPDALIGVFITDVSRHYNLPDGCMKQNVRHCLDRPACVVAAQWFRFGELRKP